MILTSQHRMQAASKPAANHRKRWTFNDDIDAILASAGLLRHAKKLKRTYYALRSRRYIISRCK